MKEAQFYRKFESNKVQCTACNRRCSLDESEKGLCGVRKNIDGVLRLIVYGKAASLNPDPIEKKPLYHFLPGTKSLSVGTYGCNFFCTFCQNHEISQSAKKTQDKLTAYKLDIERIVAEADRLKCPSISYTYSEPTTWTEYTLDTIELAQKLNIKAIYVSNGYQSKELMRALTPVLDAVNIDLKSFSDEFYRIYAKARLKPVLENIEKFHTSGVHVEITTLLIDGLNDSPDKIRQIAEFIYNLSDKIPWHISRFIPNYQMMNKQATPVEKLIMAYDTGKEIGLKYVYLGNVRDIQRSSTYCSSCGSVVIHREIYSVDIRYKADLKCQTCGAGIDVKV